MGLGRHAIAQGNPEDDAEEQVRQQLRREQARRQPQRGRQSGAADRARHEVPPQAVAPPQGADGGLVRFGGDAGERGATGQAAWLLVAVVAKAPGAEDPAEAYPLLSGPAPASIDARQPAWAALTAAGRATR